MKIVYANESIFDHKIMTDRLKEINPDFEIVCCRNTFALERAVNNECDILITELDLGHSPRAVVDVIKRFKKKNKKLKVVIITVYSFHEVENELKRIKYDAFESIPVRDDKLKQIIEGVCRSEDNSSFFKEIFRRKQLSVVK